MARRIIYWFRNDLRLRDNQALYSAVEAANEVVPVYVFDPRQFEKTKLGFRRTGALRARFLIESVTELRNRIRAKGGDLLIRVGDPETIVAQLAEEYAAEYVYTSKEIAPEETRIESSLSKNLKTFNVDIRLFWMDTMINAADLPFPISKLPSGFAGFNEQIRKNFKIKDSYPEPDKVTLPSEFDAGSVPTLPTLGIDPEEIQTTGPAGYLSGGEGAALELLENYVQGKLSKDDNEPLTNTRLSDWLSLGCLSAPYIYNQITSKPSKTEDPIVANLLKREFLHWTLLRYGPRMFKPSGIKHHFFRRWSNDHTAFQKWTTGQTDNEELNAIVRKLNETGFITTSEREIAANFLVNKLDVNWTWGAMYFESHLIDYEASVNWGRWNKIAEVGED